MSVRLGFAPLLTLVFIILKLFGAINWSWLMVLSPLWIGATIVILLLSLIGLMNFKR